MQDEKIICKDCGQEFIHSVRDQEFYKQQGFDNKPVRCRDCRKKRKDQRNNTNAQQRNNINSEN